MSSKVLILLDSDVVIHLFKAEKISLLNELFPGRIRMLDAKSGDIDHLIPV
jgi:alanine dehydrogenase